MNATPPQKPIDSDAPAPAATGWRGRLHEIIFEADTPIGKWFDIMLLVAILLSVLIVMLDSVESIRAAYHTELIVAEWCFTILFTIEYVLRIICVQKPLRYVFSFFGIVDLLAIIPTYLLLFPMFKHSHSLAVIRALRLLRIFRVFKLARYLSEASALRRALWVSRAKIIVFLTSVLIVVVIMGSMMYLVEGKEHGFDSIPHSMYWAIVTMTTVGYGDIRPETPVGMFIASIIMILGYSFIIIPTGIISAELARPSRKPLTTQNCAHCLRDGHDHDASHCKFCGESL